MPPQPREGRLPLRWVVGETDIEKPGRRSRSKLEIACLRDAGDPIRDRHGRASPPLFRR
jgi:hypothetical protein